MVSIFSFSDKGCKLAQDISKLFSDSNCYTTQKLSAIYGLIPSESISETVGEVFNKSEVLVFIGACGIAVRSIAPYVKSKVTDPAVVVIDDCGNYVISLLSGHIGGANEITTFIAHNIGATPIITTATDINGRFSVDTWAYKNHFIIDDMKAAKEVSAEILINTIGIFSDIQLNMPLPIGLDYRCSGDIGVCLSYKLKKPFENTLNIIPICVCVGMGCKRDTEFDVVEKHFLDTLSSYKIDLRSVSTIASIDIKKDEQALIKLSEKYNKELVFYSSEQLKKAEGQFTSSEFVCNITGVDNVCERAACLASNQGKKLADKNSYNGVTTAIYVKEIEVQF